MPAEIATSTLGILAFLFIFWKRLKEDYAAEIIFKSAFYILTGILIGFLISWQFSKQAFLWLAFFGGLAGLAVSYRLLHIKFYESLEALVIAALPWISFIFLKDSVLNSSLNSFVAFLATLIIIFIYYYLDQHYKDFTWYKSGKIGFSGLAILAVIFLLRTAIATGKIHVISFLSSYEAVASGAALVISLIFIFLLGRKNK